MFIVCSGVHPSDGQQARLLSSTSSAVERFRCQPHFREFLSRSTTRYGKAASPDSGDVLNRTFLTHVLYRLPIPERRIAVARRAKKRQRRADIALSYVVRRVTLTGLATMASPMRQKSDPHHHAFKIFVNSLLEHL